MLLLLFRIEEDERRAQSVKQNVHDATTDVSRDEKCSVMWRHNVYMHVLR